MAYSLVGRTGNGPITLAMDATGDADTVCQIAIEIMEEYKLITPQSVVNVLSTAEGLNEEGELLVDLLPEETSIAFPHKRVSLGMYKVF